MPPQNSDAPPMGPIPPRLEPLPPSAKLVYVILAREGPLTRADVCNYTKLPGRTTDEALDHLREEGEVEKLSNYADSRQHFYRLSDEGSTR